MTMSTSTLVSRLRESVDVFSSTFEILTPFENGKLVNELETATENYKTITNELSDIHANRFQSDPFKQQEVHKKTVMDKCHAYLTNAIQKHLNAASVINDTLDNFEQLMRKVKINLDLTYQVNQIDLLSDLSASKIKLSNAVSQQFLSSRLNSLRNAISLLKDVKALHNEPVKDEQDSYFGGVLKQVCNLFNGEPVFKKKLETMCFTKNKFDIRTRIEDVRPVQSSLAADKAGYNNITCGAALRLFGKIADELTALRYHWFVESAKYTASNQSRVVQTLKNLTQESANTDTVSHYPASAIRLQRFETASKILINVIYPTVLKEMKEFTQILNNLGEHRVIDSDSKVIENTTSTYQLEQRQMNDIEFMKFAQGKLSNVHTSYITKTAVYCSKKLNDISARLNADASIFNNVEKNPIFALEKVKNFTAKQMCSYLDNWAECCSMIRDFTNGILNTDKPVVDWNTLHIDINTYHEFKKNLTNKLLDMDIDSKDDWNSFVIPTQYNSPLRINTELESSISSDVLGYNTQESNLALQKSMINCIEPLETLHAALSNLVTTLQTFPEATHAEQESCSVMYALINDIMQLSSFMQYDAETIKKTYGSLHGVWEPRCK